MSEEKAAEILGLNVNQSSEKGLRDRYLELVKQFHPDTNGGDDSELNEKMKEINGAYDVLQKLLGDHGTSYYLYTKQRIDELKRIYVNDNSKKFNLKVVDFIKSKIAHLESFANNSQDTRLFDDEYKLVEQRIVDIVKRYKKRLIDEIEKKYGIVDSKSQDMFVSFCNKIISLNNVYDIEDEYLEYIKKYRQEFKYGDIKLNSRFIDAQRDYLIKTYIGGQSFNDKEFNDKRKEIIKLIDDFFKSIDYKQTKIDYDIKLFSFTNNLETNISKFKNEIFDNIIDKEYMVNYPYVMVTTNINKNKIKGFDLSEIYLIYNETKDYLSSSVGENIWNRYDVIIENNKNIPYFNNVIDYFKENVDKIIKSIDVTKKYKPINLENMLIELASKYDKMNKKRNIIIKELRNSKLDKQLIENLEKADDFKNLEEALDKADKYLKELKNKREEIERERTKNLTISKFKSDMQFRISRLKSNIMLRVNYDDIKRHDIMDRIEKIFEFYKNDKLDNIDDLKKVEFLNYEADLSIVNKLLDKKDNIKRDVTDDGFNDIEQIFRDKDKKERIKKAFAIRDYLDNKYTNKGVIRNSNLTTYSKMNIRAYIADIINKYIDGDINDISELSSIGFMNYDDDMRIINSYLGLFKNNKRGRY